MLSNSVEDAVFAKITAGEPFTSACISHPLIKQNASIRHFDVNEHIKTLWRSGQMVADDGTRYVRETITVWPNGPGAPSSQAWLYYPDNGYDPSDFNKTTRVLIRNQADVDGDTDTVVITNTADGSPVVKQCQVQQAERTLNVPRVLIKALGWQAGDQLQVDCSAGQVRIEKVAGKGSQKVDNEGRIRLHGKAIDDLGTASPTAMLVEPTTGSKYLLISQASSLPALAPVVLNDDADDVVPACPVAGSVWNS